MSEARSTRLVGAQDAVLSSCGDMGDCAQWSRQLHGRSNQRWRLSRRCGTWDAGAACTDLPELRYLVYLLRLLCVK